MPKTTIDLEGRVVDVHREPGWCIPSHDDATVEQFKRDVLEINGATESGRDRLVGSHKNVPFEIEVGKRFVEPDDGTDHGVVLAILRVNPRCFGVVTTRRGLKNPDPLLVGDDEVLDEVSYAVALKAWERRGP